MSKDEIEAFVVRVLLVVVSSMAAGMFIASLL